MVGMGVTSDQRPAALGLLLGRMRTLMAADVCSVYFIEDDERRHVIAATDGLSSNVIGQVRVGLGEGVAGRIAESHRPLNLERIPADRDQDFLSQTGERHYGGALGVPAAQEESTRRIAGPAAGGRRVVLTTRMRTC